MGIDLYSKRLTIGEKILIAQERRGMSTKILSRKVYIDGQIKDIKNPDNRLRSLKSGVIKESDYRPGELEMIAYVLEFPMSFFSKSSDIVLDSSFNDIFPNIDKYFDLLNASILVDKKMCFDTMKRMLEYMQSVIECDENTTQKNGINIAMDYRQSKSIIFWPLVC